MSLRLQIKKKMMERSPRVKAIDFHPQNTWVVFALYSGTLSLHDYSNNTCIRTVDASNYPVRAVKFLPQRHWIICASDDFQVRVFNYNTMEKQHSFEAHQDFIRAIIVHPTQPLVITASDEKKIKVWQYDTKFSLKHVLQGHQHFVLALAFNPKDSTKFASGSMDKTLKLWNVGTEGKANLTLTGHKSSVNTVEFFKGDRPHIASGSDDCTIKIWDYQTKQCLTTMENHKGAVTGLFFHPELPILVSSSEDGKSIIHHANSYTILNILEHNLGMGWAVSVGKENTNILAIGYDEGYVLLKMGNDDPVVSICNGKVLWTKSMDIYSANLKAVSQEGLEDGDKVSVGSKELGATEIYPTYLRHSPNSHHFALCNRKQFVVIKTASFKTVVSGSGTNLVWQNDSDFSVLDNDVVTIYRSFEKAESLKMQIIPQRIFEGGLLGVANAENTLFYDWGRLSQPLHSLPIGAERVWWGDSGEELAIASESRLLILRWQKQTGNLVEQSGAIERVTSGVFVNGVFYYATKGGKMYFSFLGQHFYYANSDKKQFILGAVPQQDRLYLFDRTNSLYSHHVPFTLFSEVKNFVSRKHQQQPQVPPQFSNRVAKCYHVFGFKKQAYHLTDNMDHKFDLALQMGMVREAHKIAVGTGSNQKLRVIGDLSLKKGEVELAIECYKAIDDLNSLLMIYSSLRLPEKLKELAIRAEQITKMNVAYQCYYLTNQPNNCIQVLVKSKRFPQAALFARTYVPDQISNCVKLWKESLLDETIAAKISDPTQQDSEDEEDEEEENGQQDGDES